MALTGIGNELIYVNSFLIIHQWAPLLSILPLTYQINKTHNHENV